MFTLQCKCIDNSLFLEKTKFNVKDTNAVSRLSSNIIEQYNSFNFLDYNFKNMAIHIMS